jgi:hypothetical protein
MTKRPANGVRHPKWRPPPQQMPARSALKQGTVIKSIRLTDNPEEIDCRHDAIKGLVLRTEFVRKR